MQITGEKQIVNFIVFLNLMSVLVVFKNREQFAK